MIKKVDFIAYHDLQVQAGASIFEEMSKSFECRWKIGPNQIPSGAEIAIMLDHLGFHPMVRKGKGGYKHLFYLTHDLGDLKNYRQEYVRLKEFDVIFVPNELHLKYAKEQLAQNTIVLQTGWVKYDQMNLSEKYDDLKSKIENFPFKYTIMYAPGFAWSYEWKYLLPLFRKLSCNIIVKNHIYVNSGQPFPKGQESEYEKHLKSAEQMEKALLEFNTPNMIVAPREINICSLFRYIDVIISDQSSVSLEFLPFGLSIETGRYNQNENDIAPESSRISEEVVFLDKSRLCEVLSSIQSLEQFIISEKSRKKTIANKFIEKSKVSAGKLTATLIKNYLTAREEYFLMHKKAFINKLLTWICGHSMIVKDDIENKMLTVRELFINESRNEQHD